MPPKQKPKKKTLVVQGTIDEVKRYWPDYTINADNILQPKRDFVIHFYARCVNDLDQKIAFLTKLNPPPLLEGYTEEERLYINLSKIAALREADFMLGDLYVFEPKRLNSHMLITMHHLISTENEMEKLIKICDKVLEQKDMIQINEEKLNAIRGQLFEKQSRITVEKSENKKLEREAAALASKYNETIPLIEKSNLKLEDFKLKCNKRKYDLELKKKNIENLRKIKSELESQIVTEEDYRHLEKKMESLEDEEIKLEEALDSNNLVKLKEDVDLLDSCLPKLNLLKIPEDIFKLSDMRVEVQNEKENVNIIESDTKKSKTAIEEKLVELEGQKLHLTKTNLELQESLRKVTEDSLLGDISLKNKLAAQLYNNQEEIETLKKEIIKIKDNYQILKLKISEKYEVFNCMQNKSFIWLEEIIKKCNQLEEHLCKYS
ncbi:hypothetical protein ABEB36_003624 [Hypothenemus hampei]|uniref:Uncharacterized protein n=1 Tax=Hypothenemus hampei TaxID=57062 RepID=A0ABD1FCF4_HYPHA